MIDPLLTRRSLLALAAGAALPVAAHTRRVGRLVIVGGAEDRVNDRAILNKFVHLCGGPGSRIELLTAASSDQEATWRGYEPVFRDMGADNVRALPVSSAEEANTPEVVERILSADGVFMTGGDQGRLMQRLWETAAARALHTAFHLRGSCIGGTSAGAAVMSRSMLAQGDATKLPEKGAAVMDIGLGFLSGAIVDQHFSERRRLGRLLAAVAQRPDLLGVGIDEDTALVIERGEAVEVFGQGAVIVVDGRHMRSNIEDVESSERLEMLGLRLHVLPTGHRYAANARGRGGLRPLPASLQEAVSVLVAPGPIRG